MPILKSAHGTTEKRPMCPCNRSIMYLLNAGGSRSRSSGSAWMQLSVGGCGSSSWSLTVHAPPPTSHTSWWQAPSLDSGKVKNWNTVDLQNRNARVAGSYVTPRKPSEPRKPDKLSKLVEPSNCKNPKKPVISRFTNIPPHVHYVVSPPFYWHALMWSTVHMSQSSGPLWAS